jgi:hypothetical protein
MAFSAIEEKQNQLIRKALGGGALVGAITATPITAITSFTGTAPNEVVDLDTTAFTGYEDLGFFTDAGISHSSDVTQSDVTSWQSRTPTRSDTVSETTQVTVVMQETKKKTIALYNDMAESALTAAAGSGEVGFSLATRPTAKYHRLITIAVDDGDAGEIYIARFFPRAKVVGKAEQVFDKSDNAIGYGVTFQGFIDSALGYSQRVMFGGPGWKALLAAMNFA